MQNFPVADLSGFLGADNTALQQYIGTTIK